jgi:hypothetical protein
MGGAKKVFPGWIPDSRVMTVNAPPSGASGETVVLAPLSTLLPAPSPAKQGIKIPIGAGRYYLVEARKQEGVDGVPTSCCGPKLYDQGILIQEVTESADPPVQSIDSCDTLTPSGCQGAAGPGCTSGPASVITRPAYCWPYPLWHVGDTFDDALYKVRIAVVAATGGGYAVTVTRRSVGLGHPDVTLQVGDVRTLSEGAGGRDRFAHASRRGGGHGRVGTAAVNGRVSIIATRVGSCAALRPV